MLPATFARAEGLRLTVSIIYLVGAVMIGCWALEGFCLDTFRFINPSAYSANIDPCYMDMPLAVREGTYLYTFEWWTVYKGYQIKTGLYCLFVFFILVALRERWVWAVYTFGLFVILIYDACRAGWTFIFRNSDCQNNPFCWKQTVPCIYNPNSPNEYWVWFCRAVLAQLVCETIILVLLYGLKELVAKLVPDETKNRYIQVSGSGQDNFDSSYHSTTANKLRDGPIPHTQNDSLRMRKMNTGSVGKVRMSGVFPFYTFENIISSDED